MGNDATSANNNFDFEMNQSVVIQISLNEISWFILTSLMITTECNVKLLCGDNTCIRIQDIHIQRKKKKKNSQKQDVELPCND